MKKKLYKLQAEKFPPNQTFWFSPLNYYILTIAITIASFFLIWGLLHSLEEEMPWITAGIAASLIIIFSVIIREVILRKTHQKTVLVKKRLDYGIKNVYKINHNNSKSDRLTLQRNAEVLREIERKSKSSKSFAKLPAAHLEVFEMCEAYLQKSDRELGGINKSSPRFAALSNGQKRVNELRRFHLISWAALESQSFIQRSRMQNSINEKLENSNRALDVLNIAIQIYPDEQNLLESVEAIRDYIVSIKVNHWIEQAERAAFKENYQRAISHYKDALFFLARENDRTNERELIAEKINHEIEILREKSGKQISK